MNEHKLDKNGMETIAHFITQRRITGTSDVAEAAKLLKKKAVMLRESIYGREVFIRGLIEISNICKNDCFYCGIRKSNSLCERYRLTPSQIIECVDEGYYLGFRTFVMQGGEDAYFSDDILCDIITEIKSKYPDCAVTLSLGERSSASYQRMYDAGADRYLLRHETAEQSHYQKLHPETMSYTERMNCLSNLKSIGYQVGCGFMVGSPFQTAASLAMDLKFIESFRPDMCGIGPFIPHKNTPFKYHAAGTLELTCYLLSVIRIIYPPILLPSTTALSTISPAGRERGIQAGANVIMPNLSPQLVRKQYELYDNKAYTSEESAQCLNELKHKMRLIGYEIVSKRGDIKKSEDKRNLPQRKEF